MICTSSYFQSRGDCPAGAHHYPASPFLAAAGGSTAHQSVQRSLWEGLVGWFGICGLISGLFVCFLLFWGDWSGDRLKQIQNKLAKEFCCHIPSPPTNCGSDQGLAARTTFGSRCCMPASFRPKFESGETQRDRLEDPASRHGSPAEETERGEDEDGGAGGKDFCPLFACQSGATMIVLGPAGCPGGLPAWTSSLRPPSLLSPELNHRCPATILGWPQTRTRIAFGQSVAKPLSSGPRSPSGFCLAP